MEERTNTHELSVSQNLSLFLSNDLDLCTFVSLTWFYCMEVNAGYYRLYLKTFHPMWALQMLCMSSRVHANVCTLCVCNCMLACVYIFIYKYVCVCVDAKWSWHLQYVYSETTESSRKRTLLLDQMHTYNIYIQSGSEGKIINIRLHTWQNTLALETRNENHVLWVVTFDRCIKKVLSCSDFLLTL